MRWAWLAVVGLMVGCGGGSEGGDDASGPRVRLEWSITAEDDGRALTCAEAGAETVRAYVLGGPLGAGAGSYDDFPCEDAEGATKEYPAGEYEDLQIELVIGDGAVPWQGGAGPGPVELAADGTDLQIEFVVPASFL